MEKGLNGGINTNVNKYRSETYFIFINIQFITFTVSHYPYKSPMLKRYNIQSKIFWLLNGVTPSSVLFCAFFLAVMANILAWLSSVLQI